MMSDIKMIKAGNDAAQNDEVVTSTTIVTQPVGLVTADADTVVSSGYSNTIFQNMPSPGLNDYMLRLVDLGSYTIASTDSALTLVTTIDPWALFLANTNVAAKTATFSLIRGTLEVVIVSAIPPSCYGSYVWSALCNSSAVNASYDVAKTLEPRNAMQVNHYARIDCADSENVVMQLPFVYPYDYTELPAGPTDMWALSLVCLAPIASGIASGLTTGHFRVYARCMPDYKLVVPHFQGKERAKGALKPTENTKKYVPEREPKKATKVSEVASAISASAAALSIVPVIGEVAAGVSTIAAGVGAVASWFGFTRENDERNPTTISMRSVSNVAHFDGSDSSDLASLTTGCEISADPMIAGNTNLDEGSFTSLFNRWTLVSSISWSDSDAVGTDLGDVWVSPFFADISSALNVCLTTAGYVGLPFEYWRGDMEYLIIIPVSKFHRGSVQMYWSPYGSGAPAVVTNITMNKIIDVGPGREDVVTIGYARATPYLPKYLITPDVPVINTNAANGCLRFRVVNELVSQNASGDTTILVFARAGANMDFQHPSTQLVYPSGALGANELLDFYEAFTVKQGKNGALGDEDSRDTTYDAIVPSSGSYPGDKLLWGECVKSVRALMQKPSWKKWYNSNGPTTWSPGTAYNFPIFGLIPGFDPASGSSQLAPTFDWANYYRPLFVGVACSERFKVVASNGGTIGCAPVHLAFLATGVAGATWNNWTNTLAPMTYVGQNKGAEFLIPWYNHTKFLLGRRVYSSDPTHWSGSSAASYRATCFYIDTSNTESLVAPGFALYTSFGPDIRLVEFRQVPTLTIVPGSQDASVPFYPLFT